MMNYLLRNQNVAFPVLFVFAISCYGQTKTEQYGKTGLDLLSFRNKNAKLTKTQDTDAYQNVHCIIQDKEGNIWLGTTGEGVYRYE